MFLVGYFGFDNLGDEAIRMAIERAASRFNVRIVRFATRGPSDDERAVPVRGLGVWRYIRAIREADRVVLGGGGILKDEGLRLPLELFATAAIARALGRRVSLLAVGVGPFYTRIGRWLIARTAQMAQIRTVRDASSAALLESVGVRDVVVAADPVLSLPIDVDPTGRTGESAGSRRQERPIAVVSVRPWFQREGAARSRRRAQLRQAIGGAVQVLVDGGWQVTFVPLHWPRDRDESQRLVDEAGLSGRVAIVGARLEWDDLVALIRDADLVLAMRYHALIAAAMAGRPAIAIAYEPKVADLATSVGLAAIPVEATDLAPRLRAAAVAARDTVASGAKAAPAASAAAVGRLKREALAGLGLALSGTGGGDVPGLPADPRPASGRDRLPR